MLQSIFIQNLVIIQHLALDFSQGLSVLSGETGAGKSILIDALGLILGNKTDKGFIRADCDRAEVSATFDVTNNPQVQQWLEQQELDDQGECILRRILVREGRSKAFVNGRPVPLQQIKALGELLIDIHGQHEHQLLLRNHKQRQLLDTYAGHRKLLSEVQQNHQAYQQEKTRLKQLTEAAEDRANRISYLQFQINELQQLNLTDLDLKSLDNEHSRLANSEELNQQTDHIIAQLYDNDNALQPTLAAVCGQLEALITVDAELSECATMLKSANIEIQEAVDILRQYRDAIETDPSRLQAVEQQIGRLHEQARKHRLEISELAGLLSRLEQELDELNNADEQFNDLQSSISVLEKNYLGSSRKLTDSRLKAGQKLASRINKSMPTLGLKGARFNVAMDNMDSAAQYSANGMDKINFEIATNEGQPMAALAKVASGGELSRISLAIQVATADCGEASTMIFDEVDVGIGGAVAETVGKLLRQLGSQKQVMCVTHLAQVASQGHRHFKVEKQTKNKKTLTTISLLDEEQRINEIARMSGGSDITKETLAHAKQLIMAD